MRAETERPTCATCPYYQEETDDGGWCHRNPPVVVPTPSAANYWGTTQPETDADDWCGEHPDFQAWIAATRQPATVRVDKSELVVIDPGEAKSKGE